MGLIRLSRGDWEENTLSSSFLFMRLSPCSGRLPWRPMKLQDSHLGLLWGPRGTQRIMTGSLWYIQVTKLRYLTAKCQEPPICPLQLALSRNFFRLAGIGVAVSILGTRPRQSELIWVQETQTWGVGGESLASGWFFMGAALQELFLGRVLGFLRMQALGLSEAHVARLLELGRCLSLLVSSASTHHKRGLSPPAGRVGSFSSRPSGGTLALLPDLWEATQHSLPGPLG